MRISDWSSDVCSSDLAVGARIETACAIAQVKHDDRGFHVATDKIGAVQAESLVVASGGLSIPSMGASGFGYQLARQFGHTVLPTRAALVPLTLGGTPLSDYADLSGQLGTASCRERVCQYVS